MFLGSNRGCGKVTATSAGTNGQSSMVWGGIQGRDLQDGEERLGTPAFSPWSGEQDLAGSGLGFQPITPSHLGSGDCAFASGEVGSWPFL